MNTNVVEVCQIALYLVYGMVFIYGCQVLLNLKHEWYTKLFATAIVILCPILSLVPMFGQYSYYLILVMGLCFGLVCGKGSCSQRLLVPLMLQELLYSFQLFINMIEIYMISHGLLQPEDSFLGVFLLVVIYGGIAYLFKRCRYPISELKEKDCRILFIFGCCYQVLIHIGTLSFTQDTIVITLGAVIQVVMMLSFYFLFLFVFIDMIKRKEAELRFQIMELNERLSKAMELQLKETYEENRTLRHDLKNHMMMLQYYLTHHEWEAAKRYFVKMNDMVCEDDVQLTENKTLNYILNTKRMNIRQKKRKISIKLYDDLMFLDPFDIVAVFGNLLDNALEHSEEQGWIQVWIGRQMDHIVIEIKNSCDSAKVRSDQEKLITSKKEKGHGIGISSVVGCVKRNKGTCHYSYEDNVFVFHIDFPVSSDD